MSKLKQLISQTAWYGISSILARFLNYLLTPLYTSVFAEKGNGEIASIYASITFLNILFSFGLETYYFRFAKKNNDQEIFNFSFSFLLLFNLIAIVFFWYYIPSISTFLGFQSTKFFVYALWIILFDALSSLPFASLRFNNKVSYYVIIRISNIALNIFLNIYFIVICPNIYHQNPHSLWLIFYNPNFQIEYVFISNLISSALTFFMLLPILKKWRWYLKKEDLKTMLFYSLPLVIIGFSGMINETIDRIMLPRLVNGDRDFKFIQNGIYAANYKLSILITLFIQAFRMGAEPFFFKHSQDKDSPHLYAKIMNYFVLFCCVGFLGVMLFLNIWQYFISAHKHTGFAEGLKIVPILLSANIFLGMYYNVSIWYKIKNKTFLGALIAIFGAFLTIIINYHFIPQYGYVACAWATFFCYLSMLLLGYFWGKKYFPVPYHTLKIILYLIFTFSLGYGHYFLFFNASFLISFLSGFLFLGLFLAIVFKIEKKEFIHFLNKN